MAEVLEQVFPMLAAGEERALIAAACAKAYAADQIIFDQGVELRAIFIIEDGAVRVEQADRGAVVPLALMEAGEFFGEVSFVDRGVTSARTVADRPTRVRVVDGALIDGMIARDREFGVRFHHSLSIILARRLRRLSGRSFADYSWG